MPAPLGLAQAAPASSSAARMAALLRGIGRATDLAEAPPQPVGFVRFASFSPGAGAELAPLDLANRRELALELAAQFDHAPSEFERELHLQAAAFVLAGAQPGAPRLSREDLGDAVRASRADLAAHLGPAQTYPVAQALALFQGAASLVTAVNRLIGLSLRVGDLNTWSTQIIALRKALWDRWDASGIARYRVAIFAAQKQAAPAPVVSFPDLGFKAALLEVLAAASSALDHYNGLLLVEPSLNSQHSLYVEALEKPWTDYALSGLDTMLSAAGRQLERILKHGARVIGETVRSLMEGMFGRLSTVLLVGGVVVVGGVVIYSVTREEKRSQEP